MHLSQWQYWWWFWFSLVWALYFLILIRAAIFGSENFKPTINTSLRSHGKWGDFLVSLIPLSWCGNILINSNFILRMIEWQNESSLFTIRIQGKQWYWVYKYNSDTNYRLQNIYINVGNNNWFKTANYSNVLFNNSNSTLIYVYEYEFKKLHKSILDKNSKIGKELKNVQFNTQYINYNNLFFKKKSKLLKFNTILNKYLYNIYEFNNINLNNTDNNNSLGKFNFNFSSINSFDTNSYNINFWTNKIEYNLFDDINSNNKNYYESDKFEDVEETLENIRIKNSNFPIKLTKGILNKHNLSLLTNNTSFDKNIFFSYRLNNNQVEEKISQIEQFWGFRQKKYKKLRSFVFNQNYKFDSQIYKSISNYTNNENFSKYNLYNGVKNNKHKSESISVTLARRLLRTKRTLILPAHINISIITSSYDVVHSWFIPGLGLKVDCVPGRSTHLTLYIDNVGFYYGQCAEICGRYHHHMPIRVCALNYEHFLLWWQTKGLPRMYRSKSFLKNKSILLNKFNKLYSGLKRGS